MRSRTRNRRVVLGIASLAIAAAALVSPSANPGVALATPQSSGSVLPVSNAESTPSFTPGDERHDLRPQFVPPEKSQIVQTRRHQLLQAAALDGGVKGAAVGAVTGAVLGGGAGALTGALIGGGLGGATGALVGGSTMGPLGTVLGGLSGMAMGCVVGLPALLIGCLPGAVIGGAIGAVAGGLAGMTGGIVIGGAAGTAIGAGAGGAALAAVGAPVGAAIGAPVGAAIGAGVAATDANVKFAEQNLRDLESWAYNIRLPKVEVPVPWISGVNR